MNGVPKHAAARGRAIVHRTHAFPSSPQQKTCFVFLFATENMRLLLRNRKHALSSSLQQKTCVFFSATENMLCLPLCNRKHALSSFPHIHSACVFFSNMACVFSCLQHHCQCTSTNNRSLARDAWPARPLLQRYCIFWYPGIFYMAPLYRPRMVVLCVCSESLHMRSRSHLQKADVCA